MVNGCLDGKEMSKLIMERRILTIVYLPFLYVYVVIKLVAR